MTSGDVAFVTSLQGESDLFTLTQTNCEGVFATGEYCAVSIVFNVNNDVREDKSAILTLNETTIINFSVKDAYVPPTPPIQAMINHYLQEAQQERAS